MKRFAPSLALAAIWFCFLAPSVSRSAPATQPATRPSTQPSGASEFMRFMDDGAGGGKLETALVTYTNADGVRVHLVAAVHVADRGYYEKLNKTFGKYDALLYEMVKPKAMGAPLPGHRSTSMVSGFQRFLKDALALDYQLDDIDYTKPNFVHADLDAETFYKMQSDRGESLFTIMLHSMLREMERQAAGDGPRTRPMDLFDLLAALRAPDSHRQLKLLLARQFDNIEDQMAGMDGPDGSVIITERNKKCLETLKEAIADGDQNIGIFYGAGHMHDLSHRVEAMGFHKTKTKWRVAWDMTADASATRPAAQPAVPATAIPSDK